MDNKTEDLAYITGRNWFSISLKMFWIFIMVMRETWRRRRSYPRKSNPWSNNMAYFGVVIRLVLKEDE